MVDVARDLRWPVDSDVNLRAAFEGSFNVVYSYAARLAGSDRGLAEDLVQDAFVRLLRAARSGAVREIGAGWLITVVRNRFIDHVRQDRSTRSVFELEVGDAFVGDGDSGLASSAVESLRPLERLVLTLHHVDGYPVREVAAMIGKSERATESVLARARSSARHVLARGASS